MTVVEGMSAQRARKEAFAHGEAAEASIPGALEVTRVTSNGPPSGFVRVTRISNEFVGESHGSLVSIV